MINLVANIYFFDLIVVLADSSSVSKADKLNPPSLPPFIQDFVNNELFAWVFWIFTTLAVVATAIAAFTGNLQKIIDFFQKNLSRKRVEVSDEELSSLRRYLLDKLKSDISERREKSLHELIVIDLKMEEQRQRVGGNTSNLAPKDEKQKNFLNRIVKVVRGENRRTIELKPTQKIIDFFDREDINGKLLILGEPGAGKTTELLSLTQDLIQRAIEDKNTPLPIIFELSSWNSKLTIRDWLIEKLSNTYKGIPKAVSEKWLDERQIIPLLDGLDELSTKQLDDCIIAINKFLDSNFYPGLIVCCRQEEYEQAEIKLKELKSAVYLQPLSDEQIEEYLEKLNRLSIWNQTIVNNSEMLKLVRKPLFLNMLVVAYQGRAIENKAELFEKYIETQFNNPNNQGTYPPRKTPSQKQTLKYLIWLAKNLEALGETEFLIEELQPTWISSKWRKIGYIVLSSSFFGSISGACLFLITSPIAGIRIGYIIGCIVSLYAGTIFGLSTAFQKYKIELVEQLEFDFKQAKKDSVVGLIIGLIVGVFLQYFTNELKLLTIIFMGGLITTFMFYFFGGIKISQLEKKLKKIPNQGIKLSFKNMIIASLIYFLFFGFVFGLIGGLSALIELGSKIGFLLTGVTFWLVFGLIFGIAGALSGGLKSIIQYFALRSILYLNKNIPWNYALFLAHAEKHRFIQRVGGRYRFMHDLLRKHFAQMPLN